LKELLLERGVMTVSFWSYKAILIIVFASNLNSFFLFLQGTIPQEIGDLQNLIRIDLDNNLIEGSIPNSLYSLTKLRQLDINDNGITGTISTLIGQLSSLSFFQINNNRLTGTIPTELGELSLLGMREKYRDYICISFPQPSLLLNIEVATLDNNNLQGEMPSQACSIKHNNLRVLTTDCLGAPNRPAPPFVSCSCCTSCF
jgi:Leucine-rich repeat (LRR) protein